MSEDPRRFLSFYELGALIFDPSSSFRSLRRAIYFNAELFPAEEGNTASALSRAVLQLYLIFRTRARNAELLGRRSVLDTVTQPLRVIPHILKKFAGQFRPMMKEAVAFSWAKVPTGFRFGTE